MFDIVRDIWDYTKLKNCEIIPYEQLSTEQLRTAIGMERNCKTDSTSYYIPVKAEV